MDIDVGILLVRGGLKNEMMYCLIKEIDFDLCGEI